MYYVLIMINITMTMTFMFLNHPLSMGLTLLIQTISISLITGIFSYSFWFSYILFLVMIGGMLILFIYMTSLASNEMFKFSMKLTNLIMLIMIIMIIIYLIIDYMNFNILTKNSNLMEFNNNLMNLKNENLLTLKMIYNKPNYLVTLIMVNYLFLTLIAVVKLTNIKYGPLRQKFYE
uniref:NADH dehydrogenase subunit 6 n=1 Tax=Omophron limbatum TaxID=207749 RepID=UPI002079B95B|nr:NADH dehydrogenase subunit 6 [Omophron limbatum]URQ84659.1 NADH dehydrogenase subunit 6 [Omophron limbatum]